MTTMLAKLLPFLFNSAADKAVAESQAITQAAAPAPIPASERPSGVSGLIPDGHRWLSKNGVPCYKVPVAQMQTVLFELPKISVSTLSDAQLDRAEVFLRERYDEKAGLYFVFPVKTEKQADINTRYWNGLARFKQAVREERTQRTVSAMFGA